MLQYFPNITGSLTVSGDVIVSGSIATTQGITISGSIDSASYSSNSEKLDNLDSTAFVFTSSFNTYSSSMSTRTTTLENASSSLNTASGSFSTRVTRIEGNYATTGSNIFTGAQTVCANITSTGTIIAQTLNVQQVTSSVVYSSGSNVFGCSLANTQQFTGSVLVTGSLTVTTTAPELTVGATGVTLGNVLTDVHNITGSLRITGSGTFSDLVTINANSSTSYTINSRGRSVDNASTINFFNNAGTSRYGFIYSDASTYEIGSITGTNIPLVFSTNQGERMRITHCGNITACTIDNQGGLTVAGNVDNVVLRIQSVASNGQEWRIQSTGGASGLGAGRLFFKVGGTEAGCNIPLVLTTDNGANGGRVGIGTTNPGKKLDICDATSGGTDDIVRAYQSLTTNHAFYRSQRNGGANMLIGATRDNVDGGIPANVSIVYNTNSYDMAFGTNNAERMRISSVGCIGINNTNPAYQFDLTGADNAPTSTYLRVYSNNRTVWTGIGYQRLETNGDLAIVAGATQTFRTGGTDRITIASTGIACFACQVCAPLHVGNVRGQATIKKALGSMNNGGGSQLIYLTSCIQADYGINDYSVTVFAAGNSAEQSSLRALAAYGYYASSVTTTELAKFLSSPDGHSQLSFGICKLGSSNTYCYAVCFAKSSGVISGYCVTVTFNGISAGGAGDQSVY